MKKNRSIVTGGEGFEANDGTANGRPVPGRRFRRAGGRQCEKDVPGMRQANRS